MVTISRRTLIAGPYFTVFQTMEPMPLLLLHAYSHPEVWIPLFSLKGSTLFLIFSFSGFVVLYLSLSLESRIVIKGKLKVKNGSCMKNVEKYGARKNYLIKLNPVIRRPLGIIY